MLEAVQSQMIIEKDMQQANHHEKIIWKYVLKIFIEISTRVILSSEDKMKDERNRKIKLLQALQVKKSKSSAILQKSESMNE